ncbi:hypothetical protein K438DRAFT_1936577 [Mycena galopus ATCC 62051]|nr:hypothetical protein K438DRAFT_1936577 [Mycena galopus ATCC 62051]
MTVEEKQPFVDKAFALKLAAREAQLAKFMLGQNMTQGDNGTLRGNTESVSKNESQAPDGPPASCDYMEPQFATDIRPASYDRIEPQFACAEAAKPIFPPPHLQTWNILGTYYPSLDTDVDGVGLTLFPRAPFDALGPEEVNGKHCDVVEEDDSEMNQFVNFDECED